MNAADQVRACLLFCPTGRSTCVLESCAAMSSSTPNVKDAPTRKTGIRPSSLSLRGRAATSHCLAARPLFQTSKLFINFKEFTKFINFTRLQKHLGSDSSNGSWSDMRKSPFLVFAQSFHSLRLYSSDLRLGKWPSASVLPQWWRDGRRQARCETTPCARRGRVNKRG